MRRTNANAQDVMAEIRKRAVSMAALARARGVSTSVVRAAIHRPQPTGNRVIADLLEVTVHDLWPEWFDADGHRLHSAKGTARERRRQCQKSRAA